MTERYGIYDRDSPALRRMEFPDVYFTPEYGSLCEISDGGEWYCLTNSDGTLMLPFVQTKVRVGGGAVSHLASAYGYGGFYNRSGRPVDWGRLAKLLTNGDRITHFIRFTPYFEINRDLALRSALPPSEITLRRHTYGVCTRGTTHPEYMRRTSKSHRRSLRKAAHLLSTIRPMRASDADPSSPFRTLYRDTMTRLGSSGYYHFSDRYFEAMATSMDKWSLIAEVALPATNEVIASAVVFQWEGRYLHYHLGGSRTEYLYLCPNNKLHDAVVRYAFAHGYELYHLGGGVTNDDSLAKFKSGISNRRFDSYQGRVVYHAPTYAKLLEKGSSGDGGAFPPYHT